MRVEKDFEELLELFNKHKVRYCVVGAFAVAFHLEPRYTKDLDVLVDPEIENSRKILNALHEFGFGDIGLSEADFSKPGQIIQLGFEPVRIDLITSVDGSTFKKIWEHKCRGNYGGEQVFFIGLAELIKSKKNTGRPQDKADVEKLLRKKK